MDKHRQTLTVGSVTRRTFVRTGAVFAASLALPEVALSRAGRPGAPTELSPLVRSSYVSVLGQSFTVAGTATALQLTGVQDLNANQAGREDAFALVLVDGTDDTALPDGLPELSHPQFGTLPLMLVPGTADAAGQHYVAVINRTYG
jgi:hypothetical protein